MLIISQRDNFINCIGVTYSHFNNKVAQAITLWLRTSIKLFVSNAPFLYVLKTSENGKVFRCFQGVGKGAFGTNGLSGGIYKTLSEIYDGSFRKNSKLLLVVNSFLTEVLMI